ncbi:hypothetical protein GCM10011521_05920 [Arenimonas soli]|uniref:DUF4168 domain-containing protein n=1 Tax=Arenimonas soli TaxID=2269504 RepID=A0ABQ1HC94_9GAMM|nr:hypothetical protein [Arenimonas soli]GGA70633.1 hypothetical protein GCM10011521_05920 [Arenimonas soli]
MPHLPRIALLLVCFLSAPALAKQADQPRLALEAGTSASELAEQRALIEAAVKTEAYREMGRTQRTELREDLDAIQAGMPAQGTLGQAAPGDQARLAALGDDVNELLDRAYADSRVTCSRQQQIGSSFSRKVCTTAAQRRRAQTGVSEMARGGRSSPEVGPAPSN